MRLTRRSFFGLLAGVLAAARLPAPASRASAGGFRLYVSDNEEFAFGFSGFVPAKPHVVGQIRWQGLLETTVPPQVKTICYWAEGAR